MAVKDSPSAEIARIELIVGGNLAMYSWGLAVSVYGTSMETVYVGGFVQLANSAVRLVADSDRRRLEDGAEAAIARQ